MVRKSIYSVPPVSLNLRRKISPWVEGLGIVEKRRDSSIEEDSPLMELRNQQLNVSSRDEEGNHLRGRLTLELDQT